MQLAHAPLDGKDAAGWDQTSQAYLSSGHREDRAILQPMAPQLAGDDTRWLR